MKIKLDDKINFKKLHPIESFGLLKVSLSGIRVERVEDRVNPGVPFPHKHDFYQLMFIEEGRGWHKIDFKKFIIQKDQFFIMKPGQIHSWQLEKGTKGYVIEFNTESLHSETRSNFSLLNTISSAPDNLNFNNKRESAEILTIISLMFKEFHDQEYYYDMNLRNYLSIILVMLSRVVKTKTNQKTNNIIETFKTLVEENFMKEHGIQFYASIIGITSKALAMQISRATGKSPRTILHERIILEAKRLLVFSQQSISEIGYRLGFDDTNYFTRFFKIHVKTTPAMFRKKNLK